MPNMHFYFLSLTAPQFFILKVPHTSDSSKSMKLALRSGFRGWRPVTYSPGLAEQSTPPPPSTAVIGLGMAMWSQSSLSALGILLGPLEKRGPPSAEWLSGYKVHGTHYWPPCSPHWETLPNNEAHTEERRAGRWRQTVGFWFQPHLTAIPQRSVTSFWNHYSLFLAPPHPTSFRQLAVSLSLST